MANGETADRIIRAATILFSERGFAETSLRTITGMADVNLAAVNYHFGNKKSLIQAVFSQVLNPFCFELDARLEKMEQELDQHGRPSAEQLLSILLETLNFSVNQVGLKPQRFMRLLGLAYTQSQEHLRQYLASNYGQTYSRYVGWLKKVQPDLDPVVFYWRLNFVLGAGIFTLGSFESLQAILEENYQQGVDMQSAQHYMVDALAGLLEAPHRQ